MKKIDYAIQRADKDDILTHLLDVDHYFSPSLSTVLDLKVFVDKIMDNAITLEAWSGEKLVGLLSVYFNNRDQKIGFINHIAVLEEYQKQGISKALFHQCFEYAIEHNFESIKLEVSKVNTTALTLYEQAGFCIEDNKENTIIMKKVITENKI